MVHAHSPAVRQRRWARAVLRGYVPRLHAAGLAPSSQCAALSAGLAAAGGTERASSARSSASRAAPSSTSAPPPQCAALGAGLTAAGGTLMVPSIGPASCTASLAVDKGVQSEERVFGGEEVAKALESAVERATVQTQALCVQETQAMLERRLRESYHLYGVPAFAVGEKVAIKGSSEYRRGSYKDGEGRGVVVKLVTMPIRYAVALTCRTGNIEDCFDAEELSRSNS
mmetsp:Transcript_10232/g.31787  ORF Transcript_10232/g.31787 Transcript_10232/m.31787 type:complete len:228 (-) Transcript_10232:244-927(-)